MFPSFDNEGSAQEIEAAQIEAEDVVREVITLLAKLENDRRESKKCLELERKKVQMLSSTVDAMLEQRLHTLPEEVQRGEISRIRLEYFQLGVLWIYRSNEFQREKNK